MEKGKEKRNESCKEKRTESQSNSTNTHTFIKKEKPNAKRPYEATNSQEKRDRKVKEGGEEVR